MCELLVEIIWDSLSSPPEHGLKSPQPGSQTVTWPVTTSHKGHNIRFYEDFSTSVAKKQAAFNNVKSKLWKGNGNYPDYFVDVTN